MNDFQAKALAAATSISSLTPAEALAQSFTNDTPKIDKAIKSYVALTSARVLASNSSSTCYCYFSKSSKHQNPQMASLVCAKIMLQKLNSFKIPIKNANDDAAAIADDDDAANDDTMKDNTKLENEKEEKDEVQDFEFQVVRLLWNGLVSNGKKPSKILGLEALYYVYPLLLQTLKESVPTNVDLEEGQMFMMEFGSLLQNAMKRRRKGSLTFSIKHSQKDDNDDYSNNDDDIDDDSCLLWDKDGGKEELRRRREKREQNANVLKLQQDILERNHCESSETQQEDIDPPPCS